MSTAPFGLTDEQWQTMNDPYVGMPQYPNYHAVYDPNSMSLAPGLKSQLDGVQTDPRGINQFRKEALRSGASPWANLATAKSYNDESQARDTLAGTAGSNAATGRDNLAMRGGLRSGAAERVQTGANRDFLNNSQSLSAQGMTNRNQVGINDEQNRITQLGLLPGMENDQANLGLKKIGMYQDARTADVSNTLKENENLNTYNLARYKTQGDIWGSGKQADATANSGGGSWICTESALQANRAYTRLERRALKKVRSYGLKHASPVMHFYLYECKELTRRMRARAETDWQAVNAFIAKIVQMVLDGNIHEAFITYAKYTCELIAKYWPECESSAYLYMREVA